MNRYQRIWSSPSFAPRAKLVGIPATSYKRSRIQRELLRGARSLRRLGARPRLPSAPIDLVRVFAFDVTVCPARGGRLRLIAALTDPASVRRYLQGVGLPTEPPPLSPPRAPPQKEWDFAA